MKTKITIVFVSLLLISEIAIAQQKYISVQDGYWYDNTTWSPSGVPGVNDTAIIASGTNVTLRPKGSWWFATDTFDIAKLNVVESATLSFEITSNWFGNKIPKLSVWDTLKNNGTIKGDLVGSFPSLTDQLTPIYANKSLTGRGNFSIMSLRFSSDATIEASADQSLSNCFVRVFPNITVLNYGKLSTDFIIRAESSTSTWNNKANAFVSVGYTLMDGGRLICNETGNTVQYFPIYANVPLSVPVDTIYYNLETGGTDTVINNSPYLFINNNMLISASVFESNSNRIYLKGDWTNYGDFFSDSSTVLFDGNRDQIITSSSIEDFENLVLDNNPNKIILASDIAIHDTLSLNTIVQSNTHTLTIGESATNIGVLNYQGGKVLGKVNRWVISQATPYLYPIGTTDYNSFVNITFPTLETSGITSFEFINSLPGNNGLPLKDGTGDTVYNPFNDGYWVADTSGGFKLGANTYSISLNAKVFNAFTINDSTKIIVRPHQDSLWRFNGLPDTNDPANYIVNRKNLSSFPFQFALADTTNCSPPTLSTINGPTDVCRGDNNLLYTTDTSSSNTYFWNILGGAVFQDNGDSVLVNWDDNGGYAKISVYAQNACTFGNTISNTINIHSIPPPKFYGLSSVPEQSDSIMYRIDVLNNYSYTYQTIGGATIDTVYPSQDTSLISFTTAGYDTIMVIAKYTSCPSDTAYFPIYVYNIINSVQTGSWYDPTTWDCKCSPLSTDNVRINPGHDVKIDQYTANGITYGGYSINNVVLKNGGSLTRKDAYLDIKGDVINNGIISYQSSNLQLLNNNKVIDGIGNFVVDTLEINGNRNITPNAVLTVQGNIKIGSNKLTNSGNLNLTGDIVASTGTFVNDKFAKLSIQGNFFPSGGELIADSTENTIIYNGANQDVISVSNASDGYYNLIIGGNGTKTASGNLTVLGNFAIQDTGIFDITNKTITIYHNWNEFSTAADPFIEGSGAVLFTGTEDQYIYAPFGETFYDMKVGQNATLNILPNQHFTVSNNLYIDGTLKMQMFKARDTLPSFIYNNDIIYGTNGMVQTDLFINSKTWTEISPAIEGLTSASFTRAISSNYNANFYWYDESIDLNNDPSTEPDGAYNDTYLSAGWKYAHNGKDGSDVPLSIKDAYLFYTDRDMTISMAGNAAKVSSIYDSTLSYTNNDPNADGDTLPNLYDGWNFIGNPYTAYLNADSVLSNSTNIDQGVYVWDDANGQYAGYQNGFRVMAGTLGNIIPPLQGFFVRANDSGASVKIRPEYRTHGKQMFLKSSQLKQSPKQNAIKLAFTANGKNDYFAAYFSDEAGKLYDGNMDMLYKYSTAAGVPHLYSYKGKVRTALYSAPNTYTNYTVPLYVNIDESGTYQLNTAFINGLNDKFILLKDLKTQEIFNLRKLKTVNFDYSKQDSAHRFDLLLVQNHAPQLVKTITTLNAYEDSIFTFNIKPYFKDIDEYDSLTLLVDRDSALYWMNLKDTMLVGKPVQENVGKYKFTIIAKDILGAETQQLVNINIYNTNDAPICNYQLAEQTVSVNDELTYTIPKDLFTDPDIDDSLSIKAKNVPQWLSYDEEKHSFAGTPTINDAGNTYNIKLVATDMAGAQSTVDLYVIVEPKTQLQNKEVNIYPNPVIDNLNIIFKYPADKGEISIYTSSGKLIKKLNITDDQMTINLADLRSGLYIVHIKNGDKLYKMNFTKL